MARNFLKTKDEAIHTDTEKVDYLISHPALINSYGADTAASFLNTLRDSTLDANIRKTRITKLVTDLDSLINDLNQVVSSKPEESVTSSAKEQLDQLTMLKSMGEDITKIDLVSDNTKAIEHVNELVDTEQLHCIVLRAGYTSTYDPIRREGVTTVTKEYLDFISFDKSVFENKHLGTWVTIQTLLVLTLVTWYILGLVSLDMLMPSLGLIILVNAFYFARKHQPNDLSLWEFPMPDASKVKREGTIPMNKLKAFLKAYSKFKEDDVNDLFNMQYDTDNYNHLLNATPVIETTLTEMMPVFENISESEIRNAKFQADKLLHKTLLTMGKNFDEALIENNPVYILKQKEKAEAERLSILEKLETNKKLKLLSSKRESALNEYLNKHQGE